MFDLNLERNPPIDLLGNTAVNRVCYGRDSSSNPRTSNECPFNRQSPVWIPFRRISRSRSGKGFDRKSRNGDDRFPRARPYPAPRWQAETRSVTNDGVDRVAEAESNRVDRECFNRSHTERPDQVSIGAAN